MAQMLNGQAPSKTELTDHWCARKWRTIQRADRLADDDLSDAAMVLREAADAAQRELADANRRNARQRGRGSALLAANALARVGFIPPYLT